jgi:hypothetical protein
MHYRARMYDPQLGRFISEDPIGFAGGDVNLYGYVWSNPISFTDPMGLDGWGNDFADWADRQIEAARRRLQPDPHAIGWNTVVNFAANNASGAADMFRVGSGIGRALFEECLTDVDRLDLVAVDVVRGGSLFLTLAGPFASGAAIRVSAPSPLTLIRPRRAGVYDMSPSGGRYIGQSVDMEVRSGSHFDSSGKFSGQEPGGVDFFDMPGSTKLEREVYEQYRIDNADIDTLQNVRNPMGGRRDQYNDMIEEVIRKYNLPH